MPTDQEIKGMFISYQFFSPIFFVPFFTDIPTPNLIPLLTPQPPPSHLPHSHSHHHSHHHAPFIPNLIPSDAFNTFENERDSRLPKRSISRALRALGIAVTEAEVSTYVASIKDQSIDLNTFKSIVQTASAASRPSLQQTLEHAGNLFKTEDGKINLQDMKQALSIVCEKLDDDDIDEFLGNANVDGNGNISAQELQRLFQPKA